jgi:hypothetical protein
MVAIFSEDFIVSSVFNPEDGGLRATVGNRPEVHKAS